MSIPIFDGYNMPVENFIEIIEYIGRNVPPIYMQDFVADILTKIRRDAWDIAQKFSYRHFRDVLDLLYKHFNKHALKCRRISQDLWDRLPSYDGYNMSLDDFAYEVIEAARYVPPQFYEVFLDIVWDKVEGEAKHIIEDSDINNHEELLETLAYFFRNNYTKDYLLRNNGNYDQYGANNVVADCGPPRYVPVAALEQIHSVYTEQKPSMPLYEARERNIQEMNETCKELIFEIIPTMVDTVLTVIAPEYPEYHNATIRPCYATCCPSTVLQSPTTEDSCIPFQSENYPLVHLGNTNSQLCENEINNQPITYEAITLIKTRSVIIDSLPGNHPIVLNTHNVQMRENQTHVKNMDETKAHAYRNDPEGKILSRLVNCYDVIQQLTSYNNDQLVKITASRTDAAVIDKVSHVWADQLHGCIEKALLHITRLFLNFIQKTLSSGSQTIELRLCTYTHEDHNYFELQSSQLNSRKRLISLVITWFPTVNNRRIHISLLNFKFRKKEIISTTTYLII